MILVLTFKEKLVITFLAIIAIGASSFLLGNIYMVTTDKVADYGGSYIEGVVGQPSFINPLLEQTSEVDEALVNLIYSGLLKYDNNDKLVNDLAEDFTISEDGKEYIFKIKHDIKWHDGENLSADDILFTVNTLQDSAFHSPARHSWQGVKIEKIDDYTIRFNLEKSYFGFLENLTLGIMPKHIWKNVTADKFPLVEYNLKPIGSGAYKYIGLHKDSDGNIFDYELNVFDKFFGKKPYISKIAFNFYADNEAVLNAYNRKEVNGVGGISPEKSNLENFRKSTKIFKIRIPWSFTVFFNKTKNVALANEEIRKALNLATDKNEIIEEVLNGEAIVIDTPFFPSTEEYFAGKNEHSFDIERANKLLDENGWKDREDGIRKKDDTIFEFTIVAIDMPELIKTAEILSQQWKKIGAKVNIKSLPFSDIQQNYIKPREYDALLVGQSSSFNVDPYSFWHSSQKRDPGLNYALFDNSEADKLIDEAREDVNKEGRVEKYHNLQEDISKENPAVFLFSPHYLYLMDGSIKGFDADKINASQYRFNNVDEWYVKTKRIWKK